MLTTIMMASDTFFMRAVGWQYVDGGILAYFSLTMAAITAAATTQRTYAFIAVAGFLMTSMAIVHMGSAPLGLAALGYAMFMFDIRRMTLRKSLMLLLSAALGFLCCQVIYGSLNIIVYRTNFLFEVEQIAVGLVSRHRRPVFRSARCLICF